MLTFYLYRTPQHSVFQGDSPPSAIGCKRLMVQRGFAFDATWKVDETVTHGIAGI